MWQKMLRSCYLASRRVLLGTGISVVPPFSWIKRAVLRSLRKPERTLVMGSWMRLDPNDRLALAIYQVYEPEDTAFVGSVVRPGDTVVDIGANIGYYTCYMSRLVGPQGHVLAFEPDADVVKILRDNVQFNGYSQAMVENKAVTEKSGPLTLYREEGKPDDNRIFASKDSARSEQPVEGVCLDDCPFLRDHPPAFIKMDIQGAEIYAIRGMRRVLSESPEVCMLLEYWPYGLIQAGFRPEDMVEALTAAGLKVCRVAEKGRLIPVDVEMLKTVCGEGHADYINLVAAHEPRMKVLMAAHA